MIGWDNVDASPVLENMIYSPLSSPWTIYCLSAGAAIMLISLIILFIYCFKGKISCSKEESTRRAPSRFNRSDILHLGVVNNEHKNTQNKKTTGKESLCNPKPKANQKINVSKPRKLPPHPIIGEKEVYYLEAYLEHTEPIKKGPYQTKMNENNISNSNLKKIQLDKRNTLKTNHQLLI